MNRGILQSSPVQQMMAAGSPNWWNINNMRPPITQQPPSSFLAPPPNLFPQYMPPPPPTPPPPQPPSSASWTDNQEQLPESWSQLLLGGLVVEEDHPKSSAAGLGNLQTKKLENWEEQLLQHQQHTNESIKQENSGVISSYNNMYSHENAEFQAAKPTTWSQMIIPVSSPTSCITTLSSNSNMLDFSSKKSDGRHHHHPPPDRSSECNSTATTGGAAKKARVQPSSSTQSTFKVRKEKLGDRITALHQLVSPFGKTDTASVLLEAIGYIRFLQSQIEALSLPYLGNKSAGNMRQQQPVQGDRNCLFPEDPGQLLNENCLKRKGTSEQDCHEEPKKDLRSRGLCLVPISCTLQVGSDNGADYWAPALGGGC